MNNVTKKSILTYLFVFICLLVAGCATTIIGTDQSVSAPRAPVDEETISDSYKLGKTPTSKILDTFGEGIKYTIDVLVEGIKGTITGAAVGVVGGGIGCLETLTYPPIYAACVASIGVMGAGIGAGKGIYSSLTEPHD